MVFNLRATGCTLSTWPTACACMRRHLLAIMYDTTSLESYFSAVDVTGAGCRAGAQAAEQQDALHSGGGGGRAKDQRPQEGGH